jgi:hypothetical protein
LLRRSPHVDPGLLNEAAPGEAASMTHLTVRATGLIKPLSKPAPNFDLIFAYGHFTHEI